MSDCFVLYLLLTCMKKKTSGADKFTNNSMPLYSSSRGMKKAEVEKLSNKETMERVSDCKMVYRETYAVAPLSA